MKTSTNQSTKFQEIQRKFEKTVFSEEKSHKINEMDLDNIPKTYNQVDAIPFVI